MFSPRRTMIWCVAMSARQQRAGSYASANQVSSITYNSFDFSSWDVVEMIDRILRLKGFLSAFDRFQHGFWTVPCSALQPTMPCYKRVSTALGW